MSRAPLTLSVSTLFCAAAFLALADEQAAISSHAKRDPAVARAGVEKRTGAFRFEYHPGYRHYGGYDEGPAIGV